MNLRRTPTFTSVTAGVLNVFAVSARRSRCRTSGRRRTLSELERDLGEETFIRIHRAIIVNLDRVQGLELQSGGDYAVVLKSGARLRLSRRFHKRLQERMDAMLSGHWTTSRRGYPNSHCSMRLRQVGCHSKNSLIASRG